MKALMLFGIAFMLLFAGCTTPIVPQEPEGDGNGVKPVTCRTIEVQEMAKVEECGPVSYTEEVCGIETLESEITLLPKVDICSIDGPCSGLMISDCSSSCTKAMTRCVMVIKNLDDDTSGKWTVGANFTLSQAAFIKDPISIDIRPGEIGTFDFNQFYNPGSPISTALCNLYVLEEPQAQNCHGETRTKEECEIVEKLVTVEREVCD